MKTLKSDVYTRICTQLTFDLILGLWGISRLGIHPYPSYNTSRYTLSMDAKMYSKMPTDFFSGSGWPTIMLLTEHHFEFPSLKGDCTGSSESELTLKALLYATFSCFFFVTFPLGVLGKV